MSSSGILTTSGKIARPNGWRDGERGSRAGRRVAWSLGRAYAPTGASGFGVRLLVEAVAGLARPPAG